MATLLLSKNANITFETDSNCVALHLAATKGSFEFVKILLEHAKKLKQNDYIYSVDNKKWTALHYASFHGNKEVVYYLLYWDADYNKLRNMKNTRNKTAFEILTDQNVKKYFKSN
jgi:ankyrin repeat protein